MDEYQITLQAPPGTTDSLDRPPWNVAKRRWMASATSTRGRPSRGRSFASDRQGSLGRICRSRNGIWISVVCRDRSSGSHVVGRHIRINIIIWTIIIMITITIMIIITITITTTIMKITITNLIITITITTLIIVTITIMIIKIAIMIITIIVMIVMTMTIIVITIVNLIITITTTIIIIITINGFGFRVSHHTTMNRSRQHKIRPKSPLRRPRLRTTEKPASCVPEENGKKSPTAETARQDKKHRHPNKKRYAGCSKAGPTSQMEMVRTHIRKFTLRLDVSSSTTGFGAYNSDTTALQTLNNLDVDTAS
ncbi:hypothetical protein ANN_15499 [Periplaneta americana]|uniref:Uncharacterized protein n=1 Tax=Periplaneta americana TaxID=6978 RepID=A0ABQ8SGJ4_PERAM|nr:hypothetical protein ANN_15499 [Periplaneta americana]